MYTGGRNMAALPEIDHGSLCFECPLNTECGTALMPGLVLSCGKKQQATKKEA